jgi:hypothetical protein
MYNTAGTNAVMRFEGGDGGSPYSFAPNRVNAELHVISAIGTNTLTFDDPVTFAFRQSGGHDARVYWPTIQGSTSNPFLQKALIENLSITKAPNGGIQFEFCYLCGAKNIECEVWIAGCVDVSYTLRNQIE